jgi:hypothetical protein
MLILPGIFLILSELYLFFDASWFWLLVLCIFSYFSIKSKTKDDYEYFRILIIPPLFFFLNLYLYRVIDFIFPINQLYLIALAVIFGVFLRIYAQKNRETYAFQIIPLATAGFMSFLFFHADFLQNFFLKEIIFFTGILFLLEGDRKMFSIFKNSKENQEVIGEKEIKLTEITSPTDFISKPIIFSLIASIVLVELAWILNFLPINFISLAGIWLSFFFLSRESIILFHKKLFSWKIFLPELAMIGILIFVIMITATWGIY